MKLLKSLAAWLAGGAIAFGLAGSLAASAQQNQPQTVRVQTAPAPAQGWARDRSDLPHDPDYILGELPNGMRYLILPNQTPPRQIAMRMVIDAGSMQERPGEEGVAHLLEHLAFRGTRNYPDGEVQRALEAIGLQMAQDVNASTGPDRTTFILDLPRNDDVSIDTGLDVMRELVSEMAIDPAALETERGVVLAEERSRAGPQLEASKALLRLQLGDHPYGRPPIGYREVIASVTAETIRGFYDAFYRPERATLLIVGDVNPTTLIPKISAEFGGWSGRGPAGKDPGPITTRPPAPDVSVLVTEGSPDTSLILQWFEPYVERPRTRAERRRALVEALGNSALMRRVQGFNDEAGKPARLMASAAPNAIAGVWRGQVAFASGVTDPARAVDVMVKAHRQAVEHGITQEELDRQRTLILDAARREAERGRTGTSVAQVENAIGNVVNDAPFVSLQQTYAILAEQAPTITLDEVNASLRQRLKDRPTLIYRGSAPPPGGEAGLRAAFDSAMAAPVAPYTDAEVKPWPYTDFGKPGAVAERRTIRDLGVVLVRFENGVKLTVKPLPSNKDLISVRVRVGGGRLQMPMNVIDASDMGLSLWDAGGLGKLTDTEIGRTLAGKRVGTVARTLDDAYALDNMNITTREDFNLQMELMAAYLTDAAYRADDWAGWMQAADAADASLAMTPSGVLERELDRLLHGGDLRWTINTKAMRDTWKPEDSVKYIKPIVDTSPIEVIVVGDIGVEAAIAGVQRTLGALPPRTPWSIPKEWRDVKFHEPGTTVLEHRGRADQGYALIGWPTFQGAYKNIREERVARVLSNMLRDNATRKFRSEGGATYSPMDLMDMPTFLPDYGFIAVAIEIPPDRIDGTIADIEAIASELATNLQPQSEIDRIVQPALEQSRRNRVTNVGYWIELLANAHDDPSGMEYIRTEMSDLEGITPEEVRAAAKKWFRPDTAWRLKIVPAQ